MRLIRPLALIKEVDDYRAVCELGSPSLAAEKTVFILPGNTGHHPYKTLAKYAALDGKKKDSESFKD